MNLAVGFFDGLHVGHRRILSRADAALTFREHPLAVLAPERVPPLVMTSAARLDALARIVHVRVLDFTPTLAAQTASVFADWLHAEFPSLRTVLCGANWTFGRGGEGTPDVLRAHGFDVEVVPYAEVDGFPVSSTRVRTALAEGRLEAAAAMLGRPWRVSGQIVSGKGVGRELGFPTLNVRLPKGLVNPPRGVYVVGTPFGRGLANWGCAPTMGGRAWPEPMLEIHLLDGAPPADAAARGIVVDMLRFVRPERHFGSTEALREQIAVDVASARAEIC